MGCGERRAASRPRVTALFCLAAQVAAECGDLPACMPHSEADVLQALREAGFGVERADEARPRVPALLLLRESSVVPTLG